MGKRNKDKQTHVWMTPEDFVGALETLWGNNCREGFCAYFDLSPSQMYRYVTFENGQSVPKALAIALTMLLRMDTESKERLGRLEEYRTPIHLAKPAAFSVVPKPVKPAPEVAPPAPDAGMEFDDLPEPEAYEPEPEPEAPALDFDFIDDVTEPEPEPDPEPEPEPVKETKAQRDARKKREKRAAEKAAKLAA